MIDLTLPDNVEKKVERVVEGPTGKLFISIDLSGVTMRPYPGRNDGGVFVLWGQLYIDAIERELEASRRRSK